MKLIDQTGGIIVKNRKSTFALMNKYTIIYILFQYMERVKIGHVLGHRKVFKTNSLIIWATFSDLYCFKITNEQKLFKKSHLANEKYFYIIHGLKRQS